MRDPLCLARVVGAVVQTERRARGLTQQALARASDIHLMGLSKIERGCHADVGVETLSRIARGLSTAGGVVTAASLLATAEQWQSRLAAAGETVAGGDLVARMLLLGTRDA